MNHLQFTYPDGKTITYPELFEIVQQYVSTRHSDVGEKLDQQPKVISRFLINQRLTIPIDLIQLSNRLAQDMGGTSFLSKYLDHLEDYPTLEEINVNAWNSVVLKYTDRPDEWLEETFISPRHAFTTFQRMVSRSHSDPISQTVPGSVSYIIDGVRNTVLCDPVVPKDVGVCASIRVVRPQSISNAGLINGDEMTSDMLELLVLFMKYKANIIFSGKPRAGKTALLNYLLSIVAQDPNIRIGTIEEGARELMVRSFDENGRPANQVLSLLTYLSDEPKANFNSNKLLEYCLRYDLDYLVPQEMRSYEAYAAQESARTGMAVYTTIHCNFASAAYPRIVTLCQQKSNELASTLLNYAVEAFPISTHLKLMKDGKRRCMEIVEAEGVENGHVKDRVLYRYQVKDNIQLEDGSYKIIGQFVQENSLSDRLMQSLLDNGAPMAALKKYV